MDPSFSHHDDWRLLKAQSDTNCSKKKQKTLWPLFMDGVQLPQG